MRKCLVLVLLFSSCKIFSQDSSLSYIDISRTKYLDTITNQLATAYIPLDLSIEKNYNNLEYRIGKQFRTTIPPKLVSKKIIATFKVANYSDSTRSVYFFPGFYFDDIRLFRQTDNGLIPLPRILPIRADSLGYRLIVLAPHDSAVLFAQLHQVKTYNNNFFPRLVNPNFLPSFITDIHHLQERLDEATYVFSGLLLMMILFSLANYIQGRNRDFLYYSGYAFFLAAMLFSKAFYNFHAQSLNYFLESWLDYILQSIGYVFYMIFMQKFLENQYPFLHRLYRSGIIILLASVLSYSFLHFATNNYVLEYWVETSTKIILLAMIVAFTIYSLKKWNDKLLRLLVWGNLSLFVFSLISQTIILFKLRFHIPAIFNAALFYYQLGLFLELVFFLMALSYKNRQQIIEQTKETEWLKMENQRKEFEKQMAVVTAQQEERNRISTDMHDELGSGMTAIRLMSEIAKNKMKENTPQEIEKISQSADDVLNKMNAIIWSMNSKNDSLGNLISYIRLYALEYLEATQIDCKVNIPEYIPEVELTGDKRRNIFLCVKESLNNVLKHSKCTALKIDITVNSQLMIRIHDNGIGINLGNVRQFGNGLQNIERRMESIGGNFHIQKDNGTVTTLKLPL
jgi:signal transduction histidine kinase